MVRTKIDLFLYGGVVDDQPIPVFDKAVVSLLRLAGDERRDNGRGSLRSV